MNSLKDAINILLALAVLMVAVVLMGNDPGSAKLVWHGWEATTTAATAAIATLVVAAVFFYLGQLVSWLLTLPTRLGNLFQPDPATRIPTLISALVGQRLGLAPTAKLGKFPPTDLLTAYTRLTLGLSTQAEAEAALANPTLAPLATLVLAQTAARAGHWATANDLTATSTAPALRTLHLKAQLNLGQTDAAKATLAALKPTLSKTTFTKLTLALQGPTALTAAALDDPWFQTFQHWLATDDPQIPSAN